MAIAKLFIVLLVLPLVQIDCSKGCLKPDGSCYPDTTTEECLRDPFAYKEDAVVAHGNLEELNETVTNSRNFIIGIVVNDILARKVDVTHQLHYCADWMKLPKNDKQKMNIFMDTVCRNLSNQLLPEGPTIESLNQTSQVFCLPWKYTDGKKFDIDDKENNYLCLNPTNSSAGPYCYVSENHALPCFRKCAPEFDSAVEFKLGSRFANTTETNCHSVCELQNMDCSFDNFNLIPQSALIGRLEPLFKSSKKCSSKNTVPFLGNDIIASIWSFPFYKFSTHCAYGFESRTFVPSCEGDIPNSTEYARVCPCKMKPTTTQITKAATREISIIAKNPPPSGKSEDSSQDKKENKDTIIISCVLSAFAVVIILLIIVSVFIYRSKRSKPKISPKHKTKIGKSGASSCSKPDSQMNKSSAKSSPKTKTSTKSTANKTNKQSSNVDHKTQEVEKLKMKMSSKSEAKSEVQPEIYLNVNELQNVKKDFKTTKGELKDKGAQSGASLPSRTGTVKVTPLKKPASKSHKGDTLDYENLLPHNFKDKPQFNKITKNSPMKPGDKTTKTSKSRHGDTYDFITPLNFKKRPDQKTTPEKHDNKAKTKAKDKTELSKIQEKSFK